MSRLLFLAIVAIELAHTATAAIGHRVPAGHDGFQYFTLQYYFLNNALQSGEVAQWIPYLSHGTVATFWYSVQGSFLQSVLLHSAPLLPNVDLLTVFHLGMFVDAMILLTGTWLLSRRFFRTPAVFFIAVSVVGSGVWMEQPYWNFRLYYALPLVLELGHRFLETGRWRWFLAAANLLALQAVSNLPYFIPVASFAVFTYFAAYTAASFDLVLARLRAQRWGWRPATAMLLAVTSFAVAYACLTIGTDELVTYSPGRQPDGSTALAGFLSYGGRVGIRTWLDLVLNGSPWLDMTLYAGILMAPLLLIGLIVVDRRRIHFVVAAIVLLLFTFGTVVSIVAFHAWPGMRFFRHIALVSPLVKVLFCFVAGIGFEWLLDASPLRTPRLRVASAVTALLLLGSAALALTLADSGGYLELVSAASTDGSIHADEPGPVARRLRSSGVLAIAGGLIIGATPIVLGFRRFRDSDRLRLAALGAVLLFVTADVYRFKFDHLFRRSDAIGPAARFVTRPSPMTFPETRADLTGTILNSPRMQATLGFNRLLLSYIQGRSARGTQYWTNHVFLFTDEAGSSFRMDSWLRPLDQLMRMNWDVAIDSKATLPTWVDLGRLEFPAKHAGTANIAGVAADKLRFFTQAYAVASAADLVPLMTDDSYRGNLLLVLPADTPNGAASPQPWTSQRPLGADESRRFRHELLRFDANTVAVRVVNSEAATAWMSYADVWHPSWRATVNGRPVPVYRANMAYKAVPLEPGENLVEFRFGSRLFSVLAALAALNAAVWLGAVAWMIRNLLRASPLG